MVYSQGVYSRGDVDGETLCGEVISIEYQDSNYDKCNIT